MPSLSAEAGVVDRLFGSTGTDWSNARADVYQNEVRLYCQKASLLLRVAFWEESTSCCVKDFMA